MKYLAMLLATVMLAGCSEGISQETFDQITVGMTQTKVEEILGSGEEQTSGGHGISAGGVLSGNKQPTNEKTFLWKEGSMKIIVNFKNGAVVSKSKQGF
jgi:hypothetical protein